MPSDKFCSQCYYVTFINVTSQKVFDYSYSSYYRSNLGYSSIYFVNRTSQLFTSGLNRSNPNLFKSSAILVEVIGLEPTTPCLRSMCSPN